MKRIVPNYYGNFACIAGSCRHSCCIGWEIDIDEETLEYYRSVPGEMGNRLQTNIDESGETACFRLAENERCPFLNRDGLCDLIIELGEASLCQICADHPRFRNFFSDREEIGLGLCCEAAGKLILSQANPVAFEILNEGGLEEELSDEEAALLELRDELIGVAQDRSLPMEDRIAKLLATAEIVSLEINFSHWVPFLLELERLDETWALRLAALRDEATALPISYSMEWETAFEQLIVYLMWRHLPGALDDGDIRGRIAFCVLVWRMLRRMLAQRPHLEMYDLVELCRLYSSEIEYSDENIGAILDELHRLDPKL